MKYKITAIGSRDSHYTKSWLIGKVGRFSSDSGGYKPPQGFSFGTFFPDDKSVRSLYFCEVQLEPVMEKEMMIINIDGVKLEGGVTDIYSILGKLDLLDKVATYSSSTHGEIPVCTMDTRHIRNSLLKMWREEKSAPACLARNTVSGFLTFEKDDLDEILGRFSNVNLARALRRIQPMIPNTEFHYLLKELETREDDE